jgi:hypothetical protein
MQTKADNPDKTHPMPVWTSVFLTCLVRMIQRSPRPGVKQKTEPEPLASQSFVVIYPIDPVQTSRRTGVTSTLMKNKLFGVSGQYLFLEPLRKNIP